MALAKIRPKSINMDLPPEEVGPDAWTFGKNIIMGNDSTRAAFGAHRLTGVPRVRPYWGLNMPFASPRLIYGGAASLNATDGATQANITPAAGYGSVFQGDHTGGLFNGFALANTPGFQPAFWAGSLVTVAQPFPGWAVGDRARSIRPFKYFIVAAGGTFGGADYQRGIRWSVAAEPGAMPTSWTASPTNDAGDIVLAGAREALVDMAPIRDSMMIFESHATWLFNYIGGAFTFSNKKLLAVAGLISANAFASLGTDIVFCTDGDLVISDGNSVKSLLSKRMQSAVFSRLNVDARQNIWITYSSTRKQIVMGFPTGSNVYPDTALLWNYATDDMGLIDLANYSHAFNGYQLSASPLDWNSTTASWNSQVRVWDFGGYNSADSNVIAVRPDFGTFGAFEVTSAQESPTDGPLEVIAQKDKILLGDNDRMKMVTRLYPKVEGPAGTELFWRMGVSRDVGEPTTWTTEKSYIIGSDFKVDVRITGRYVAVQVRSQSPRRWGMSGFDIEYQEAGAR